MGNERRTTPRRNAGRKLSMQESMDLVIGPGRRPAFANDDERRAAWEAHRDYLLARSTAGRRPEGFWDYDAPEHLRATPDRSTLALEDARFRYLADNGLLGEAERAEIGERESLRYEPIAPED